MAAVRIKGIHFSFFVWLDSRMFQLDLFADNPNVRAAQHVGDCRASNPTTELKSAHGPQAVSKGGTIDLPEVLERIARMSKRPRYTFMVLNLISRAAGQSGSAGPYIRENDREIPVRDWLSDALHPMAQRDSRRLAVVDAVRQDLMRKGELPTDDAAADLIINQEVRHRLQHSGRTNVSRAVSDLVRAGFVHRHYQGYRIDHPNRGAQREAVYTISPAVKRVLG